jgi:hypothetical protein
MLENAAVSPHRVKRSGKTSIIITLGLALTRSLDP